MDAVTISALIAAVAALGGVFLGQIFVMIQQAKERKHQRQNLLYGKLEEFAENLYQSSLWANNYIRQQESHATQQYELSREARRMYVLALLYFPTLVDDTQFLIFVLDSLTTVDRSSETFATAVHKYHSTKKSLDQLIIKVATTTL